MVDIERKGLTLDDWTKWISVDEFAWWSYYFSDWIQSWYDTKGFKLWHRTSRSILNSRENWQVRALVSHKDYWVVALTYDWKMEWWDMYNEWYIWAFYSAPYATYNHYLNWLKRGKYIIWIRETSIDLIDPEDIYDPTAELITEPNFDNWWAGWTLWTGWTVTDDWAVHEEGETWDLEASISEVLTTSDYIRVAIKISGNTQWSVTPYIWTQSNGNTEEWINGWQVITIRWSSWWTYIKITPTEDFDWVIEAVNVHKYDMTKVELRKSDLYYWLQSTKHPALIRWWDLYVCSWAYVNIINLSDWQTTYKEIVDANFEIVAITQQAWSLILRATDWFDSKQYYWNWVDNVASEIIEWKWLVIKWVVGTETLSYVLTSAWSTDGSISTYQYRLYAVSGYQRSLLANKNYVWNSVDFDSEFYHKEKKFEFNDTKSSENMVMFLDNLYIPWCDWIYKYWSDIPWMKSVFTRPIRYTPWATNIVLWQSGNDLRFSQKVSWVNYISQVNQWRYLDKWYIVTNSIYRDKLSTRKTLEKLKIWYKNLASEDWWINIYAIVNDDYFWRFAVMSVTNRPEIWDIYTVAHQVNAEVINVDKVNSLITFRTVQNMWGYDWDANDTLTRVSWAWDASIATTWYDNMCKVKEIKSTEQWYWNDLIFWKDFVNNYLPYRYKIQLVIELYSIDTKLTPEVYEISIASDISDEII